MSFKTDIQSALQSTDEETRRGALQKLRGRSLSVSDIRELLFSAMGDDSWRVRKEAVDIFISASSDDQSILELLELLRNEDNVGLRNSAAETLIRLGSRAVAPLKCLAGDDDPDVRKFVLDVMGSIGNSEFLPSLRGALCDRNVNVAAAAAEHLGNLNDTATVPDLIDAIIANKSDFFRFSALAALGKMTSHVRIPDEIILMADQDILRKGVYDCLGSISDETAAPILLNGFLSLQKSSRRAAIVAWYRIFSRSNATTRLRMETSLLCMSGNEVVPLLIDLFNRNDNFLAEAVTAMLGIIGDLRAVPSLLDAYASERLGGAALTSFKHFGPAGMDALVALFSQESYRSAICAIFGEVGHKDGGPIIKRALHDQSPLVRKAAVSSAGKLGLADCIPDIASLLNDTDSDIRTAVTNSLQVLALIDPNAIQEVARQLTESEWPEQRRNAAILYATLGNGERLSLLVKDENAEVRQAAVTSIGKLHLPDGTRSLLIALVDEDPDVRIAAVEALGRVGDRGVVDALVFALNDEDIWVKSAVLQSIAKVDRSSVLPAILSIFSEADGLLMITCLELLETIGGREAMDLVEAALASHDNDVVILAVSILSRQGEEWVIKHVDHFLTHPRWEVRSSWVRILSGLPRQQAKFYLTLALDREKNELGKAEIQNLLEEIA